MGSTLEHGIYLPSEGEKNCYSGLANNWQTVDTNIGYVTALRQAIAGALTRQIVTQLPTENIDPNCIYMILKATAQTGNIYDEYMYINSNWELIGDSQLDLSNYYTKQQVNELPAVASGITSTKVGNYDAHIANGDIHVTANDKSKWNTVALIKQLRLVNTQVGSATTIAFANIDDTNGIKVGDKCMDLDGKLFEISAVDTANETVSVTTPLTQLAVDSSVMHLTGNELIGGFKTFDRYIATNGGYVGNEFSSNARSNLLLRANRDTAGKSGAFISRFRSNKAQGSMSLSDSQMLSVDFLENEVRTNNVLLIEGSKWVNDVPTAIKILSGVPNNSFGSTARKCYINELNPGSLSLPDLDNGLDISGYITVNGGNKESFYTPPANGWVSVRLSRTSGSFAVLLIQGGMASSGRDITNESSVRTADAMLPVKGGVQVSINSALADRVVSAYFYPCQGNV